MEKRLVMYGIGSLIVMYLELSVPTNGVSGESVDVVSRREAMGRCGGPLVSHTDLKGQPNWIANLSDGQSAWVSGYAEYSPFLAFIGCDQTPDLAGIQPAHPINTDNLLFNCVKNCVEKKSVYFSALYRGSCFCLTSDQRNKLKPMQNCADPINILQPSDRYAGTSILMLFYIRSFQSPPKSLFRQCIYIKYIGHGQYDINSSSCYSAQEPMPVNGFICQGASTDCFVSACAFETASTWTEAFHFCSNKSKILIDSINTQRINEAQVSNLKINFKYFTGVFRLFTISDEPESVDEDGSDVDDADDNVCLAVTKVGSRLIIDPDQCSAKKRFFCGDVLSTSSVSETLPSTAGAPTNPSTKIATSITTPKKDSFFVYILLSSVAVLVVVIVIIAIVIRRRRIKTTKKHQCILNSQSGNGIQDSLYSEPSDVGRGEPIPPNDHVGNNDKNEKHNKPEKPVRRTLRRQTAVSSYENYSLKNQTSNAKDQKRNTLKTNQSMDDYDRVTFNFQNKGPQTHPGDEVHIYDHTSFDADDEDYDTMRSVKAQEKLGATYSKALFKDNKEKSESGVELSADTTGRGKKFPFCVVEAEDGDETENKEIMSGDYEVANQVIEEYVYVDHTDENGHKRNKDNRHSDGLAGNEEELDDIPKDLTFGKIQIKDSEKHLDRNDPNEDGYLEVLIH